MNRELLAQLMQQPNVTSGAASPARARPTGQSVDRNQMLMEILSQPVETPRTPHGQIAPVDASMVAALANIGGSMWGAHSAKKADEESRELLARELAMMQGGDPLADPVQPVESPVLSGRAGIRQGTGAEEAMQATEAGVLPFVEATQATRAAEAPARQEHDLAALLDPRASQLAGQRIATTQAQNMPAEWGDPEVDAATGSLIQRHRQTGEVREISRPAASGGGENSRFGSPQITQSNRLITLDRASGQYQYADTGEAWDSSKDPASADIKLVTSPDGSVMAVDVRRGVGQSPGGRTEGVVGSDTAISGAAARASAETAAREGAQTAAIPERSRVESQAEDFAQAPARLTMAKDLVYQVDDQLEPVFDRVLQNADSWTVGFGSVAKPPGSPAANMAADLQTLGANAAFDRLQQMRNSSVTGGALGQVSERELALLTSAVAAIEQSQSPEQFRSNVERLRRNYKRISDIAKDSERMDSIKVRISALQNRPQTSENQSRIAELQERMFQEEDKLWGRLDEPEASVQVERPQTVTDADPLSALTPEQRKRYGLD